MSDRHAHLGGVVYRWGRREQNHLVTHALVPAFRELEDAGRAERFLFDRFDSRGPHLFFLWTVRRHELASLAEELTTRLEGYLETNPGTTELTEEELAAHHAGCRGKIQCEVDRLEGLGDRDTVHLFEHPADGYPFYLTRNLADAAEFWTRFGRLSLWAAEQLELDGDGIAVLPVLGYLLAVDREARRRGWAAGYWRHHAGTLVLGLRERIATDADRVLDELPEMIGDENLSRLPGIWASADRLPRPEQIGALVDLAVPEGSDPEDPHRFRLLREMTHLVLKQLAFPVPRHVPLVLYAWLRTAAAEAPVSSVSSA